MENNIFEGAKFGDKFLTRDGRKAVYDGKVTGGMPHFSIEGYTNYGISYIPIKEDNNIILTPWLEEELRGCGDIVSRYQEPIDEEKLNEDANKEWINKDYVAAILPSKADDTKFGYILGFEDGYHKAMED